MAIQELKLGNQKIDEATAVVPANAQPEFVDRSEMLFSYIFEHEIMLMKK